MDTDKSLHKPAAFRFDHVSFSYGPVKVLEDVNFHIHENEFAALVGANGAGKTTILKLLLGLEKPSSGRVVLFDNSSAAGRDVIGYVPQNAGFDASFPVSVREVVQMGRLMPLSRRWTSSDDEAVEEALELTDIADLAKRAYTALSGGQRRRVLAARALASKPRLLVLDEPTANMDVKSEERLFSTLGKLKGSTTILIVTHDSSFVSSLTDVVLCAGVHNGEGRPANVVRHRTSPAQDVPSTLFGGHAVKVRHDTIISDTCCFTEVRR